MPVMTPHGEVLTAGDGYLTPGEYYDQIALVRRQRLASGLGNSTASGVAQVAAAAVQGLGKRAVKGVQIRTQITPTVAYAGDQLFDPPPTLGSWFLKNVVKPSVVVDTRLGPVTVAPYGEPTQNYFAPVAALAAVGAAAVGYLAYRGVKEILS